MIRYDQGVSGPFIFEEDTGGRKVRIYTGIDIHDRDRSPIYIVSYDLMPLTGERLPRNWIIV